MFRIVVVAERHDSKNGFVAVDNFEFIENDECLVKPPEADPNLPTTPEPTEPPGPVITCSFEFDLCDWQDIADDELHKWKRKTADEIGETPGPDQDKDGKADTYFMIAVNENEAGASDDTAAELRSPFFKTDEHPYECFSFWFYFGVSIFFMLYFLKMVLIAKCEKNCIFI